jgi:hypothetical protein
MDQIIKYPRTHHIEGSGLQKGDGDLDVVAFVELAGKHLVVEEKLDGANAGIRFGPGGDLRLQCRGHYLTGGPGEEQFALFKTWTQCHQWTLRERLGARCVLYGEWVYAKHTVYYDRLPHYFHEFDIYDTETEEFLSTERRHALLAGSPVTSVPVLKAGPFARLKDLTALVRPSLYKSPEWREHFAEDAREAGTDPRVALTRETDNTDLSEGLYVKWEEDGRVMGRYKYVRRDFIQTAIDSGTHWKDRPLLRNRLAPGAGG